MRAFTNLFISSTALATALSLTACQGQEEPSLDQYKTESARALSSLWTSPMLSFTTDECSFRLGVDVTTANFSVSEFLVHCSKMGNDGLYAPLTLARRPRTDFTQRELGDLAPPAEADILTILGSDGRAAPRGWYSEQARTFMIRMSSTDSALFNRLELHAR